MHPHNLVEMHPSAADGAVAIGAHRIHPSAESSYLSDMSDGSDPNPSDRSNVFRDWAYDDAMM